MSDERAVRVVVKGRVQGVGFRAWTSGRAEKLGLRGFVRNRSDGAVEALLAGPADAVEAMLAALAQGPPASRVDAVEQQPTDPADAPAGFEHRADG